MHHLLQRFCCLSASSNSGYSLIRETIQRVLTSELAGILDPVKEEIICFAEGQLARKSIVRNEYREFIELAVIMLGSTPQRGIHFMAPVAMHHVRWMSKVIYSLKVWLAVTV